MQQRQRRLWLGAVAFVLGLVAIVVPSSASYANASPNYNDVWFNKCAGVTRPGNTDTLVLPNGGQFTLQMDTCIQWNMIDQRYEFAINVTWSETDGQRPAVPFDGMKIHVVSQDNNITQASKDCDITAKVNVGNSGTTNCVLGPLNYGDLGVFTLTADGYVQWDINNDGKGWQTAHQLYGSPSYKQDEFQRSTFTFAGGFTCIDALAKPKYNSLTGRVYSRGAVACEYGADYGEGFELNIADLTTNAQADKSWGCVGGGLPPKSPYECITEVSLPYGSSGDHWASGITIDTYAGGGHDALRWDVNL